jgi:hypothetical protein
MDIMVLSLIAVAVLAAWFLYMIGFRNGQSDASRFIVEGFSFQVDPKSHSAKFKEINECLGGVNSLKASSGWALRELRSIDLGRALAKAATSHGIEIQQEWAAPKPGEISVTMRQQELDDIAWLADYGLRVWTKRGDHTIRYGDRLPRERAEGLSKLLDKFEDQAASWGLSETQGHKEGRFNSYEDRMKRIWEEYG